MVISSSHFVAFVQLQLATQNKAKRILIVNLEQAFNLFLKH